MKKITLILITLVLNSCQPAQDAQTITIPQTDPPMPALTPAHERYLNILGDGMSMKNTQFDGPSMVREKEDNNIVCFESSGDWCGTETIQDNHYSCWKLKNTKYAAKVQFFANKMETAQSIPLENLVQHYPDVPDAQSVIDLYNAQKNSFCRLRFGGFTPTPNPIGVAITKDESFKCYDFLE